MKTLTLIMTLALSIPSLACIGSISAEREAELFQEIQEDLMESHFWIEKMDDITVLHSSTSVGSRGNCSAVAMVRFLEFSTEISGKTCHYIAASRLMRGFPAQQDELNHIVSQKGCE